MSIHGPSPISPEPLNHGSIEHTKPEGTSLVQHAKFSPAPHDIPARNSSAAPHESNPLPAHHVAAAVSFPSAEPPPENDEESMQFATGTMIVNEDDDEMEMSSGSMIIKDDDEMDMASGSMIINDDDDEMEMTSGSMIVNDDDGDEMEMASGSMIVNDNDEMNTADGSMIVKEEKPQAKEPPKAQQKQEKGGALPSFLTAYLQKGEIAELPPEQHLAMNASGAEEAKSKAVERRNVRLNNPDAPVELVDKWVMEDSGAFKEHKELTANGQIIPLIQQRRQALSDRKEELRSLVQQEQSRPLDKDCAELYRNIATSTATIRPASGGQGGAYFGSGVIVKPKGESTLEMNNRKGYAAVTTTSHVRDAIPLYQENEREAASYEMAKALGLGHVTPPTVMAIVTHSSFGDVTDRLEPSIKEKITQEAGGPDNEKVVTLQKMIQGGTSLMDLWDTWEGESADRKATTNPDEPHTVKDFNNFLNEVIDHKSFEEASLTCLFLGENDGNLGNFLAVPQPDNRFGIFKIDNGLALPTRNEGFLNDLSQPALAKNPLSAEAKALIANADPSKLVPIAQKYNLDDTIEATTVRIQTLQKIVAFYPNISLRELGYRMSLLKEPNGADRALGALTPTDMNLGRIGKPSVMQLPQSYNETRETRTTATPRNVQASLNSAPRLDANIAIKPLWQRKLEFEAAAKQREVANQEKPQEVIQRGRIKGLINIFNK